MTLSIEQINNEATHIGEFYIYKFENGIWHKAESDFGYIGGYGFQWVECDRPYENTSVIADKE